ncbi:DsrE family protein [Salegentibacter maritimus]|uniref:Sulfur reduction protein DsrE n=1 Tax=Salegentibacter maritimus TaxID=2794347 RepID=A0ABS0TFR7_9FLAO|nr:sulfur reduction protein DsrE [Salegentibacter maritimus]MBI6119096.1 sulfur reduction protein DsrE [Salegentibacter maritimus]
MKNSILIFTALIMLFSVGSQAQDHNPKKNNYVVLTKKIPQLKPILITVEELQKEDGHHFGDFQIIVCGKTVKGLTDKNQIQGFVQQAKELDISLMACGFSLNKFGVDPKQIPSEMDIVENGILYNFQLQKKGYTSIEL